MIYSRQCALVLIFLYSVTFFSCQQNNENSLTKTPSGDVSLGGTISLAENQLPKSLDPSDIADAVSTRIGTQVHCGLLRLDNKTLDVVPAIAESWSVDELGTSYVFHIRKDAQFHPSNCFKNESREITAHDFEFSFSRLCRPTGGMAFETTFRGRVLGADEFRQGEAETLSGVQAIDDYTLRIELVKPDPSFLFILAQPSTAVVSEKVDPDCDEGLVGAGPFLLDEHDGLIRLVRFDAFFQKDAFGNSLPYIDTLIVRPIPTKEKQLDAFFAGDIDLVTRLYLDPIRNILEEHTSEFASKDPQYILKREGETAGDETYTIHRVGLIGFEENLMRYHDFSRIQMRHR